MLQTLWLLATAWGAQPPGAVVPELFGTAQGMPGAQVRSLTVGPSGLFVGIENGVARFDGRRFHPLELPQGVYAPFVTGVLEDDVGVWVQFVGGVWLDTPDAPPRLLDTWPEHQIHGDWVVTRTGERLLIHRWGVRRVDTDGSEVLWQEEGVHPRVGFTDSDGVTWFGAPQGLYRLDGETVTQVLETSVRAIEEVDGRLLLGGEGGLFWLDAPDTPTGPDCYVTDLALLRGRVVATCGYGMRIEEPDGGAWETLTSEHGLPADILTRLAIDAEGTVWMGTLDQGLVALREPDVRLWTPATGLPSIYVNQLRKRPDGGVFVISQAGVVGLDAALRTFPVEPGLDGAELFDFIGQPGELAWVILNHADNAKSVVRLDAGTRSTVVPEGPMGSRRLFEVDGAPWVVKPEHLLALRGGETMAVPAPVLAVAEPASGPVLMLLEGDGVRTFDGISPPSPLAAPPANCPPHDLTFGDGRLWAACDNGVLFWDGESWVTSSPQYGAELKWVGNPRSEPWQPGVDNPAAEV